MSHDEISLGIDHQENGINRLLEEAAAEAGRISHSKKLPYTRWGAWGPRSITNHASVWA